jgi:hypothetical protein
VVPLFTGAEAPCKRIKNQADVTLTRPADGLQKGTAANRSIGVYACRMQEIRRDITWPGCSSGLRRMANGHPGACRVPGY